MTTQEIKEKVIEMVMAAYPDDVFGVIPEEDRAKDGVAADCMRSMAPAIAGFATQALEMYKANIIAVLEEKKPILWNEDKNRHLENVTRYNTLEEAITIVKNI